MTYLILGSTSFAGSSLINYLLSQDKRVIGLSRSAEPHPVMQPYFNNPHKAAFTFYQRDINKDFEEIIPLLQLHKPKYFIDFAGQGMVAESWSDPAQWYLTNVVSKVKLHQYLKGCDFLERYVRISTPEVYGDSEAVMMENQVFNPSTPYAVSHAAIDMSLMAFFKQYQFPVILTRFANFYGPYQQLYRIIPRTIIYALLGKKLPLHGGGASKRMFIYANDIASGIYQAIHQGQIGQTYHFTKGPLISIHELVSKICCLMDIDMRSFVEIVKDRPGKDSKYEMDAIQSQEKLSWAPIHTLEEGLNETIHWVREHMDTIQHLPLNYIHKS